MAGPVILQHHGESTSFPTWAWPKNTRLCAKSLDPNNYAGVRVNAGAASEEFGTTGGGTNCIDRDWAGIEITVTNSRNDMDVPVQVWTE
jgi:hypothetical protein